MKFCDMGIIKQQNLSVAQCRLWIKAKKKVASKK